MTPIINPWFFYWVEVSDTVAFIASLFCIIFVLVGVINFLSSIGGESLFEKRTARAVYVIALISLLLSTLIPTKQTLTKMVLAQNVTYERVEVATDTVRDVYEDIIELFEKEEE